MDSLDSAILLQQVNGNQMLQRILCSSTRRFNGQITIQAVLGSSRPGNIYEEEADRVAEEVMRMSLSEEPLFPSNDSRVQHIGIKWRGSEEKEFENLANTKQEDNLSGDDLNGPNRLTEGIYNIISEEGSPLDYSTRGFMGIRFGYDFSNVRIHTDERAAESAKLLNALAYTIGTNIIFNKGEYQPATAQGKKLLAHELTHVIQQHDMSNHVGEMPTCLANGTVQRSPDSNGKPVAGAGTLIMGPVSLTTFDQLLAVGRLLKHQLTIESAEVPVGEPSRTVAEELVKQAEGWEPYLKGRDGDTLDQAAVNQATIWFLDFSKARGDLENSKRVKARADMMKASAEADRARELVSTIPSELAELQRSAFLQKRHEVLEHTVETIGRAFLVGSALLEIHEKCMEMVGWLSKEISHVDEIIEKFAPMIEIGHKLVASLEFLSSSLTMLHGGEGSTEIDKAASKASAGLSLASAAGSLTGIAAAYMIYFGAVLSVGQACIKLVGTIMREHQHEFNKLAFEEGDLSRVNWEAEPGGRETFDFMVRVMHANSSMEIPTPIPKSIDELLVESEKEFEAGTGSEVPTTGFWFWKHSDPEKVKYWLLRNREKVWAMLYGGISTPACRV
jgi:hypothetical protein